MHPTMCYCMLLLIAYVAADKPHSGSYELLVEDYSALEDTLRCA